MDGHLFDDLARNFAQSRRTLLGALAAGSVLSAAPAADAKKKKKKPCKKKCKTGCCTKKYGKCVQPARQSSTQCGTGGEICRSTNCGGGQQCAATCAGCCAGTTCVDPTTNSQCGLGGEACTPCTGDEVCQGGICCIPHQEACTSNGTPCCIGECTEGTCCSQNLEACRDDNDCCQSGTDAVCVNSQCVAKRGSHCEPGWMCEGSPLNPCPGSGICPICDEGESPCGDDGCCSDDYCCVANTCCSCCIKGTPEFADCCAAGASCCT